MHTNVREIQGVWNSGYSLDKHTISSTPIGYNEYGYMQYNTLRSEAGEALFQLKYRANFTRVPEIANAILENIMPILPRIDIIIPMPPSKYRTRQPVIEIANMLSTITQIPIVADLLIKNTATPAMKDIPSREEKIAALTNAFSINDQLVDRAYSVLIIDDLYDTGSSLEAATQALRGCRKIHQVHVATVTRKRDV